MAPYPLVLPKVLLLTTFYLLSTSTSPASQHQVEALTISKHASFIFSKLARLSANVQQFATGKLRNKQTPSFTDPRANKSPNEGRAYSFFTNRSQRIKKYLSTWTASPATPMENGDIQTMDVPTCTDCPARLVYDLMRHFEVKNPQLYAVIRQLHNPSSPSKNSGNSTSKVSDSASETASETASDAASNAGSDTVSDAASASASASVSVSNEKHEYNALLTEVSLLIFTISQHLDNVRELYMKFVVLCAMTVMTCLFVTIPSIIIVRTWAKHGYGGRNSSFTSSGRPPSSLNSRSLMLSPLAAMGPRGQRQYAATSSSDSTIYRPYSLLVPENSDEGKETILVHEDDYEDGEGAAQHNGSYCKMPDNFDIGITARKGSSAKVSSSDVVNNDSIKALTSAEESDLSVSDMLVTVDSTMQTIVKRLDEERQLKDAEFSKATTSITSRNIKDDAAPPPKAATVSKRTDRRASMQGKAAHHTAGVGPSTMIPSMRIETSRIHTPTVAAPMTPVRVRRREGDRGSTLLPTPPGDGMKLRSGTMTPKKARRAGSMSTPSRVKELP